MKRTFSSYSNKDFTTKQPTANGYTSAADLSNNIHTLVSVQVDNWKERGYHIKAEVMHHVQGYAMLFVTMKCTCRYYTGGEEAANSKVQF